MEQDDKISILDPDQARLLSGQIWVQSLQRFSADEKSRKERVNNFKINLSFLISIAFCCIFQD